jgi:hypothetical protein
LSSCFCCCFCCGVCGWAGWDAWGGCDDWDGLVFSAAVAAWVWTAGSQIEGTVLPSGQTEAS